MNTHIIVTAETLFDTILQQDTSGEERTMLH